MIRLLKLVVGVAGLVAFVWFGANIALGSRTLFEHLQAIGQTRTRAREAEALLESARRTAQPLVDDVRKRWAPGSSSSDPQSASRPIDAGAAPAERISDAERLRLRRLLDSRHASR